MFAGRKLRQFKRVRSLHLEALEFRHLLAAVPHITEFSASNDNSLTDGDGNSPDWIEIYNGSDQLLDLAGYHLTNDPENTAMWTFPSVVLGPGEFHVVFASGQDVDDYVDGAGHQHTNFSLRASGGYLALVAPDDTVVTEFGGGGTDYPQQLSDVSYGISQRHAILDGSSPATYIVPLGGDYESTWNQIDFDPLLNGFSQGTAALGFETRPTDRTNYSELIQTELPPRSHAVYARMEWELNDASSVTELTMRLQYDNGFIAYLNGIKVAEDNAPANPGWFAPAPQAPRRDSEVLQFVEFDLSDHTGQLVDGKNVLAIHGMNNLQDNTDMLLVVELDATAADPAAAFGVDPKVGYMRSPTPGAANTYRSEVLSGFVADTQFSVDRGFFAEPVEVEVTSSTPGAQIRYTTDGTAPTQDHGNVYAGPITITTTTTLRAAAFHEDFIPTNVDTHTYLYLADVINQPDDPPGYPSQWAREPADYGMDPDVIGPNNLFEDRYRNTIIEDLKSLPSLSLVFDPDHMFGPQGLYNSPTSSGDKWERPASVELLSPDGSEDGFHINSGIRIMGGSSRQPDIPKHSFRLEFREQYGAGKLNYPLFQDQPFSEDATDSFDELVVRTGFNNSWMHRHYYQGERGEQPRDAFVRDLQMAMGHPSGHGRFVHVYLNGMYWGIYNLQERPAGPYMAEYFGGDKSTDWDVINSNEAVDGDLDAWRELMGLVNQGVRTAEQYAEIEKRVDIVNLIDYMLLNFYVGNSDWDGHNWIAARRRAPDAQFKIYAWDSEFAISLPPSNVAVGESAERQIINTDRTRVDNNNAPSRIHQRLSRYSEYQLLFADRVQKHFFNDGVMTPEHATRIFLAQSDQLDRAVVAESARWGDHRRDVHPNRWRSDQFDLYHRDEHYVNQLEFIVQRYFPVRTDIVFDQLKRRRLYPDRPAPEFSQHGGAVPPSFALEIAAEEGVAVFYTTDGSDPRNAATDGPASGAIAYTRGSPLQLATSQTIKARAWKDGEWSALTEATFFVNPADSSTLRITEINYNPFAPTEAEVAAITDVNNDDFEFIEIQNVGATAVTLANFRFVDGIDFTFPFVDLGPAERAVVVKNRDAFALRYGTDVDVLGQYEGRLSNRGERLRVVDSLGQPVIQFAYDDGELWPRRADGLGGTLELVDPLGMPAQQHGKPYQWRGSTQWGGTPGKAGAEPRGVVINEVLTNPLAQLQQTDAIELLNTTAVDIHIGGWYLSDSADEPFKFQIPAGTTIGPHEYLVFAEPDFNPSPDRPRPNHFGLSGARGDDVWLVISDGTGVASFVDDVHFGAAARGESFGRRPDGEGRLAPLSTVTLGSANSAPRVGPVVITELHYHPGALSTAALAFDPRVTADDMEFVEVSNPTPNAVDLTGWQIGGGIDFDFEDSTILGPRQSLLAIPFDPDNPDNADRLAAFRAQFAIGEDVRLVGGYQGQLSNSGESVRLLRPGVAIGDPPRMARVVEDEVSYDDLLPWPMESDGTGRSLTRSVANGWGSSADSWISSTPTPGVSDAFFRQAGDSNHDRRFDPLDIVMALQGGKYLTRRAATWSEGDWDGDGIFGQQDIVAALQAGNYLQGLTAPARHSFSV